MSGCCGCTWCVDVGGISYKFVKQDGVELVFGPGGTKITDGAIVSSVKTKVDSADVIDCSKYEQAIGARPDINYFDVVDANGNRTGERVQWISTLDPVTNKLVNTVYNIPDGTLYTDDLESTLVAVEDIDQTPVVDFVCQGGVNTLERRRQAKNGEVIIGQTPLFFDAAGNPVTVNDTATLALKACGDQTRESYQSGCVRVDGSQTAMGESGYKKFSKNMVSGQVVVTLHKDDGTDVTTTHKFSSECC